MVRDVHGAGDCALLALLLSPSFEAPVSGADELRQALVTFASGEACNDCLNVLSLVGEQCSETLAKFFSKH